MTVPRSVSPLGVRLPDHLRARLKEMAETNHRSMNSEIVYHLERIAFDVIDPRDRETVAAE